MDRVRSFNEDELDDKSARLESSRVIDVLMSQHYFVIPSRIKPENILNFARRWDMSPGISSALLPLRCVSRDVLRFDAPGR